MSTPPHLDMIELCRLHAEETISMMRDEGYVFVDDRGNDYIEIDIRQMEDIVFATLYKLWTTYAK